jgi:ribose transport system permease protein
MSPRAAGGRRGGLLHLVSVWNLLILLVLLVAMFAALKPDTFLTAFTFRSMANSRSINALLALAVMIPLAANQFDLSSASVLGLAQVLANGLQTQQHLPWGWAVLAVVTIGAAVGLANGLLVTRARINSFIATLGTGTVLLGLNQWYTGGRQVVGALSPEFTALSGIVPGLGVPAPLLYLLAVGLVLWVVFDYLPPGRYLYVIGDSPRAAELSGIPVDRCVTLAFVASGVLAAAAGVVLQAQLQVGQSTVGQELMLPAFTGALLGATAVRPGRPNVWGTVLAVAALAVAVAGLSQLGAPFYVEPLFNGGMLILAVGLAAATQRRRERRAAAAEAKARAGAAAPPRAQVYGLDGGGR